MYPGKYRFEPHPSCHFAADWRLAPINTESVACDTETDKMIAAFGPPKLKVEAVGGADPQVSG